MEKQKEQNFKAKLLKVMNNLCTDQSNPKMFYGVWITIALLGSVAFSLSWVKGRGDFNAWGLAVGLAMMMLSLVFITFSCGMRLANRYNSNKSKNDATKSSQEVKRNLSYEYREEAKKGIKKVFRNGDRDLGFRDSDVIMDEISFKDISHSPAGAFQRQTLVVPLKDPEEVQSIKGRD